MAMYKVFVADRITKYPLASFEVSAMTRRGAKTKIFKNICEKDKSYLLVARKLKGGAEE